MTLAASCAGGTRAPGFFRAPSTRAFLSVPLLWLSLAGETQAPHSPPRGRWHLDFEGQPALAYSVHFVRSDAGDETRVLVECAAGLFEFSSRQDLSGRDSTEAVKDLATKETLSRRIVLSGFESISDCGKVRPPDACLVFEGSRGRLATSLSRFAGEESRTLRGKAGSLVSETAQEHLKGTAAVFPRSMEFQAFGDDFLALVWPDLFRVKGKPERGKRSAGCDFDARFGYPCMDRERQGERGRFGGGTPLR